MVEGAWGAARQELGAAEPTQQQSGHAGAATGGLAG